MKANNEHLCSFFECESVEYFALLVLMTISVTIMCDNYIV